MNIFFCDEAITRLLIKTVNRLTFYDFQVTVDSILGRENGGFILKTLDVQVKLGRAMVIIFKDWSFINA